MTVTGHRPVATYRLQLNKDFRFQDLVPIVEYLESLGISHLYLSPVFESTKDSNHGYDTIDFTKISAERGGEDGLRAVEARAKSANPPLRIILDIVPNHMGANTDNPYWADVLAKGRDSKFWPLFDIRVRDGDKIRLPILGGTLEDALSRGEIRIMDAANGHPPGLYYFETCLPLSPASLAELETGAKNAGQNLDAYLKALPQTELPKLLDAQNYDLVSWETVKEGVSYRRFFDITGLIGVRVEDPDIYDLTHHRLFELAAQLPAVDGVRVDHVDGLVDPATYLKRLNVEFDSIWIEKILGADERLPLDWPVKGTTGYEFVDHMNRLMVDRSGFEKIEKAWQGMVNPPWKNFAEAVEYGKGWALDNLFPSEVQRLCVFSATDSEAQHQASIFWKGLTTYLPVYRTYSVGGVMSDADKNVISIASIKAREKLGGDYGAAEARFMGALLNPVTKEQRQAVIEWQQLSGPAMAKGLEDTAHYNYTPLTALNDVGCEADLKHGGVDPVLAWLNERNARWPDAMNATSTHDTKRAEDVRHRLYALAAIPQQWLDFVRTVSELNKTLSSPGASEAYFLYQTLLGSWPLDGTVTEDYRARIQQYMLKNIKEAKQKTSWIKQDAAYEQQVHDFVDAVLSHASFLDALKKFVGRIESAGALNSLAVHTLKILTGGLPDFYQGTESWDLSLVDPDNRRPVDYATRQLTFKAALDIEQKNGRAALLTHLCDNWRNGAVKQWLTRILLTVRRDDMMPMKDPTLTRLAVTGPMADVMLAFVIASAGSENIALIVIVPRNPAAFLDEKRQGLALMEAQLGKFEINLDKATGILGNKTSFFDVIGNKSLDVAALEKPGELLRQFPIAIIRCSA